jgi:hypothetical protein
MPERVFLRINVDTHFSVLTTQRVTVSWAMEPSFVEPGPWTFTLQRGYAPTEDAWEDIATTVDQPWLYDNRPTVNVVGTSVYYRIKLVDGNGVVYYSQVQTTSAYWTRYDWSLAKEIIRKETLLLRKKTGVRGVLLKRRYFGERCPVCTNPTTGQVESSTCTTCYGTGIVGGYYPPFEYWVTMNATQRMRKLTAEQGVIASTIESVRALAYPVPEGNDVWVNGETNQRYYVTPDIKVIARHRGISLVLDLVLNEVPTDHVIYQFPTLCAP